MNLNLFTYFVIIIWIRTIYSQICVNFSILGKVGTLETRWKLFQTRPSKITPEKLGFFSSNSPKPVITRLGERSLSPNPIRLNEAWDITLYIIGRIERDRKSKRRHPSRRNIPDLLFLLSMLVMANMSD